MRIRSVVGCAGAAAVLCGASSGSAQEATPSQPPTASVPRPHAVTGPDVVHVVSVRRHAVRVSAPLPPDAVPGARMQFDPGEGRPPVVGRLTAVDPNGGWVEIGFGEPVHLGATASVTESEVTGRLVTPPRSGEQIRFSLGLRGMWVPYVYGGGLLADAYVGWRARFPFALRVRTYPATILAGTDGGIQSTFGSNLGWVIEPSLDLRVVGVGVGLGSRSVRLSTVYPFVTQTLLTQTVRVGAEDGFCVIFDHLLVIRSTGFEWDGLSVRFSIPVATGAWIVLRSGGNRIGGMGFGDAGARVAVRGNGGDGTVMLDFSVGWAQLSGGPPYPALRDHHRPFNGLQFGAGIEYRLGTVRR